MTTILIDYKNQKVYSDSQGTAKYGDNSRGIITTALIGVDNTRNVTTNYTSVKKIFKLADGRILTGCGSLNLLNKIHSRLGHLSADDNTESTLPIPKYLDTISEFCLISKLHKGLQVDTYLLIKEAGLFRDKSYWKCTTTIKTEGYSYFGSGGKYAIGAATAGAAPEESINIAALLDTGTGGDIQCEGW